MRPKLTLCVITKDEEDRLGDCLDSASFVDHIVVVDSGSADRTREIAEEKGATVVVHEFDARIREGVAVQLHQG